MPIINKTVNKNIVNGSESFIYNFNISFSGLATPALNGKIVDFFPSKIVYQLPPLGGLLISINQIPVMGGTRVEFNFGSVSAGSSINFNVSCQFGFGREQGDTLTNIADLYADNIKVASSQAETVSLILDNNFTILKYPQISGEVIPNQEITFIINIQNQNDPGYRINNIIITDILPIELIPITTFSPIGNDTSNIGFPDHTYDGRTGNFNGNTLNFTLPSYKGSSYTILFKVKVAPNVTSGQIITNTAKWTVDSINKPDSSTTIRVLTPSATAVLSKRAPVYAAVGGEIQYAISATNTGNVVLNNFTMIDTPPLEVNITKISFSLPISVSPSYSLYIATSDNPLVYKTVANNIIGTSPVYDLSTLIPSGKRVSSIKSNTLIMNPINTATIMNLYGKISQNAELNKKITNNVYLTATSTLGNINQSSAADTILNGKSVLNIVKVISPQAQAFYPLDEFQVILQGNAQKGMVFNPIFSDLLPPGIEYVPGKEYYVYQDNFSFTGYDSRNSGFPIEAPTIEVIKNYKSTGRTLVRYSFPNFTLLFTNGITINFTCLVKLNPPQSFTNYGYLGNPGSNTEVEGNSYLDIIDLDGDSITNEQIAQSNAVTGTILTTSEFSLEKWVKGNLDQDYIKMAQATAGGEVTYKLNITNNQSIDLKNIEIIDILPFVGDTGVILNTIPRNSQYTVYATEIVTAKIVNILGEPVDPNPLIMISYSTSNNPIRFNEQGTGTIGIGTWSSDPPVDITTLKSIKVTTDASVILKPYEILEVTISAKTPLGTNPGLIAYNSYAVKADKITGGVLTQMNPAEPNKVGVQILKATTSSIGQFVWNDLNENGIYEVGEPGINGITVELYDKEMMLLKTTVTANNYLSQPGYYEFSNLSIGSYYVKFIPLINYSLTTQNIINPEGSKPNQITGLTNLINLPANEKNITINAGLISNICAPPTIFANNKCLSVGMPFNPMTDVTAYDCQGNNITNDIKITSNNVDTSKIGIYHVTYQVTDLKLQLTDKTIIVKICQMTKRTQAITDIIESIALEQTALAHILNAEGEKIQRALKFNMPPQKLLELNTSVESMMNTITRLEMVLHVKMSLFNKYNIKDCCED